MYNYSKIKSALVKYKYETALEYGKTRLTYGELAGRISALSNALSRMEGECVAVCLRNSPELIICALAVSACGKHALLSDGKLSRVEGVELSKNYCPSVIIAKGSELSRIGRIFQENGCNTAISVGETDCDAFPALFDYQTLILENDYDVRECAPYTYSANFFCECDSDPVDIELSRFDIRDGIFCELAMFEKTGARLVSDILYTGHKLCFGDSISVVKRKIKCVVTAEPERYEKFKGEIIPVSRGVHQLRVGEGIFDGARLSRILSEAAGMQTACEYIDGRIQVTVRVEQDTDTDSFYRWLKPVLGDLLCPFDCAKGVRLVKNA